MRAAVNPENRTGLNRIDRLGLGNPRNASVDVAHQKRSDVAVLLPQIVFCLKKRSRQRAVRVGIDDRAIGSRRVVGAF